MSILEGHDPRRLKKAFNGLIQKLRPNQALR